MTRGSLWLEGREARGARGGRLAGAQWDLIVVGGGVCGLLAAVSAQQSGMSVCLIEARRVGSGTTGRATAKVTSAHGYMLDRIAQAHDERTAAEYQRANDHGFEWLRTVVADYGADVNWSVVDHVIEGTRPLERTLRIAAAADSSPRIVAPTTAKSDAIAWGRSALVHPARLAEALATLIEASDGIVVEGVRVVGLHDDDEGVQLRLESGDVVQAQRVVIATQVPTVDPGLLVPRMTFSWHAAIAGRSAAEVATTINIDPNGLSTRPAGNFGQRPIAVVVGANVNADEIASGRAWDDLERRAREIVGLETVTHRWSAHDATTPGLVPVMASLPRRPHVIAMTGMSGWGFTNAAAMAVDLPRILNGNDAPFWRLGLTGSVPSLAGAAARSARSMITGHARTTRPIAEEQIPAGAGVVRGGPLTPRAVCRTSDGVLHSVSARCTHAGCIVEWNGQEQAWECPCHGSMFDADGAVVCGPATEPLGARPIEQ